MPPSKPTPYLPGDRVLVESLNHERKGTLVLCLGASTANDRGNVWRVKFDVSATDYDVVYESDFHGLDGGRFPNPNPPYGTRAKLAEGIGDELDGQDVTLVGRGPSSFPFPQPWLMLLDKPLKSGATCVSMDRSYVLFTHDDKGD